MASCDTASSRSWWVGAAGAFFLLAAAAGGQAVFEVPKTEIQQGWHTVRPGETLESVTAYYLGSSERWRQNWELNPEIEDPDRIYPGQRIRVLLEKSVPGEGALLVDKARRVEGQLVPLSWQEAVRDDLLRPKDSLRTHAAASARLLFFDDTYLIVTEQTLLHVGEDRAPEPEVDRARVEIVLGQADLAGHPPAEGGGEIEIVLGDSTARPRPNPEGVVATRARRPEAGGAQLMVYSGESDLAAAGEEVRVGQGMGSAVPEGGPPSPPEELLPAAGGLEPAAGARFHTPRPTFRWQPVAGASSYTVEVCEDPSCGRLVARAVAVAAPGWQPEQLPVASHYWRVTAVAASGLDGYPSEPVPFTVVSAEEDREPPAVAVELHGPQMPPRWGLNPVRILGPGSRIEVTVSDEGSGVRLWTPHLDGEVVTPEALVGPWQTGEHTLTVVAVDEAGNRAEREERFVYDPEPPTFRRGLEGLGALADGPEPASLEGPAPTGRGRAELRAGRRRWLVVSDHTQVIARPGRGKVRLPGVDERLESDRGLWILGEDEICRSLGRLTYELTTAPGSREPLLVVEAVDCVGNRARVEQRLGGG